MFTLFLIGFLVRPVTFRNTNTFKVVNLVNITRKDIVDDVLGFTMGALAADTITNSVRLLQEIEKNATVEESLKIMNIY